MSPRITVSNGKINRSLSNAEVIVSDFAASTLKCDINASQNSLHRNNSPHHTTDNEDDVSISHFSYLQLNLVSYCCHSCYGKCKMYTSR